MPIIEEKKKNRLTKEKSPYLIQHADNPVDWYPWEEEAFKKARNQDKPIFLSIGYSTCHWCHVMADESFKDREVANLINEVFIPIKVDREERPEIDNVYMRVCQIMTGRGGWPLTIFMTPDKKPFFAATYIPKNSRYGRLGLLELIPVIKGQWENNRNKLVSTSNKIIEIIRREESAGKYNDINENILEKAYNEIKEDFDKNYGGFTYAPKFPMAHQGIFLLNYYIMTGDHESLDMVEKTLEHMKAGGIYDHLGSGYHRYSTDDKWILPHFEKMLYDQALLIYLYTIAYQITEKEIYKKTVQELIEYLKMKLKSEEGAFYSAEDADSEKEEGKFYLWEIDEIKNILKEKADKLIKLYNIKKEGNYYDESTGENNGKNILYLDQNSDKLLELLERETKYKEERYILYKEREKRIHPHKDDKVLTDWNGLVIAALAKAAFIFKEEEYLNLAEEATEFIINNLKKDDLLLHRYREGEAAINGNLDDYCFFIWGLIELYQTTFKFTYLIIAIELTEYILRNYWDEDKGGFFFVSKKENELFIRSKEIYDGAIPSGNSIALWNLIRLAHLTGKENLEEKAHEIIRGFSSIVKATPTGYTQFLNGLIGILYPYYDIIIVGDKEDDLTVKILNYIRDNYKINISITIIPVEYEKEEYLKSYIENYKQVENKTTVYICKNYTCNLPVTDADEAINILEE